MEAQIAESNSHVQQLAKSFAELRQSMQEVATLRGVENTSAFTVSEARKAAGSSSHPAERRDAQAEFLNFTGAQVGDEEGKKLTSEQGEDFSSRIAVMMKSAGYKPAAGMRLGGSILQQKTGPQDVDALMKEFGVAFQVMEKGQVSIERAAPEVAELMSMGVSSADAAKMFSVAAPAAPGQEGTAVQAAMRAIEKMKVAGNEKEFGVTNDMNPYESVKAFGANMATRKQEFRSRGMTEESANIELAKVLEKHDVASDVRERRGLIAGFGRMGTELGGFKTYEDVEQNTPEDFEAATARAIQRIRGGKAAKRKADLAVVTAERGARQQPLLAMKEQAEIAVTGAGELEKPEGWIDAATSSSRHFFGGDNRKESEIRALTANNLKTSLRGYEKGREFLNQPISGANGITREQGLNMGRVATDDFLATCAKELQALREIEEKKRDHPPQPPPVRGLPLVALPGGVNNGPIRQ